MNYLVKQVVEEAAKKWGMKRVGDKWVGKVCPACGKTGSGNDKFIFWDDGGYKCWSCEQSGDVISWLRGGVDADFNMSCAEAHEHVNGDCLSSSCPYVAKCRITSGRRRPPSRPQQDASCNKRIGGLNIIQQVFLPNDLWVDRMEKIVQKASGKINGCPEILEYLEKRGVTREIIDKNKFGYLPHDENIPVEQLGIVYDPDGTKAVAAGALVYHKKRLWIPGGIVMPLYSNGRLFAVDIRRDKLQREKFMPDLKYLFVKGGGVSYRVLRDGAPGTLPRAVVFVEARLCASLVHAACPDVAVVVGKDKPMTQSYYERFLDAPLILVATDNDNPGRAKAGKLEAAFENAHYWPVPTGKDPGEFYEANGDIQAWIEAGIAKHTPAVGEGYQATPRSITPQQVAADFDYLEIEIHGEKVYIVPDEYIGSLKESSLRGKIVFTMDEFYQNLPMLISDTKEVALRLFHWQAEAYKK